MPDTQQPLREYETIYILKPDAERSATEDIASRLTDVIRQEGVLTGVENWGRRRLAYNMGRQKRGLYVYLKYQGGGSLVNEVERTLRLQELVMKFQTVKIGDVEAQAEADEALKFEHIEHTDEDEDETLAQVLGLEAPRYVDSSRDSGGSDGNRHGDDEDEDSDGEEANDE